MSHLVDVEVLLDNYYTAYRWLMFGCCVDVRLVCLRCDGTDLGMRRCGCDGTMTQLDAVEHVVATMFKLARSPV